MVILKKPYPSISEEERRKYFDRLGYYLRRNKQTGEFYLVKKRQTKKKKSS